jgi:hypothetical protein
MLLACDVVEKKLSFLKVCLLVDKICGLEDNLHDLALVCKQDLPITINTVDTGLWSVLMDITS